MLLDGKEIGSCVTPVAAVSGKTITTLEGLPALWARQGGKGAAAAELHPLQQAFLENAALQCGICTPGFIMSAKALLDKNPHPKEEQVRHWLAGNLCRCTGYDKIVRAVMDAAD